MLRIMLGFGLAVGLAAAVAAAPLTPPSPIMLNGKGLVVSGRPLTFEQTARAEAIAAVAAVLGKPLQVGSHGDCGQGDVIGFAKFKGAFELSFVNGKLSGWTEDSPALATDRGLRVHDTVAALKKAYPDAYLDKGDEAGGGLGSSFQTDEGPSGSLSGLKRTSKISGMFAGATCLAGV